MNTNYPRTFEQFEKDLVDGKFQGEWNGHYADIYNLLYLLDQAGPVEGVPRDEDMLRQYLWHMAKFFNWSYINGKPTLRADVSFATADVTITIYTVYGKDFGKKDDSIGYALVYYSDGRKLAKHEARSGILWHSRMGAVKLQNLLRSNYQNLQKVYGKKEV